MNDSTSDRLKEFRSQYDKAPRASASPWPIVQLIVILVGFAGLFFIVLSRPASGPNGSAQGGLTPDEHRRYATYLADKNEPLAAIAAYEAYLAHASLEASQRAKVCYSVAKIAIDVQQYNKALAFLYQAEMLDPQSDIKDDIDKKIVLCLDRLGRMTDLREELRSRSNITKTAQDLKPGEVVLAEIGQAVITDRDLAMAIDAMAPQARGAFEDPEKRVELLRGMVTERLLIDKARRLGLDNDSEIQHSLAKQLDSIIVRKLIQDEVNEKLVITPEDVERFYRAEPERFTIPAGARVRIATAKTKEEAKTVTDFRAKPITLSERSRIPGVGDAQKLLETIFTTDAGATTPPIQSGDTWYVFKVEAKTPAQLRAFDEIRDQAASLYRAQKEQELVSALMEETLEARHVTLHLDRLRREEPQP